MIHFKVILQDSDKVQQHPTVYIETNLETLVIELWEKLKRNPSETARYHIYVNDVNDAGYIGYVHNGRFEQEHGYRNYLKQIL